MFFGRKEKNIKTRDVVWMNQAAKWNGIVEEWKKDSQLSVICWFESTFRHAEMIFGKETNEPAPIFLGSQVHAALFIGHAILFAEHYPLSEKEQKLYHKLSLKEAIVYSALDEPMFTHFGGEKIIHLMKQMGMKEDQSVQHSLISSSINKAQDKIAGKVINELTCNSPAEWIDKNLGK